MENIQELSEESASPTMGDTTFHFKIPVEALSIILDQKADLNSVFLLHLLVNQIPFDENNIHLSSWIQGLKRKGLLTEDRIVTLKGKQLLNAAMTAQFNPTQIPDKKNDPFEKWWKDAYPSTDYFELNGRVFNGTQQKKINKEGSRKLFYEIINEGLYTQDDIFDGTVFCIENAKELSLKSGKSEIQYISNSEKFLRIRQFAPFVEAARKKKAGKHLSTTSDFDFNI